MPSSVLRSVRCVPGDLYGTEMANGHADTQFQVPGLHTFYTLPAWQIAMVRTVSSVQCANTIYTVSAWQIAIPLSCKAPQHIAHSSRQRIIPPSASILTS
jgi:hypothetical protein